MTNVQGKKLIVPAQSLPVEGQEKSFADCACEVIRERILRGILPMGAPISRRELAAELGFSVLPVSEALQRLEAESLVETIPRVGTRVRVPTTQDIRGFTMVREALESQSARLFAERARQQERQELVELAQALDKQYEECASHQACEEQLHELRLAHMRFHMRIAEMGQCPFLTRAIEQNQVLIFHGFYDQRFGHTKLPAQFHESLATILAAGDVESADRAMRAHVRHRLDEILQRLEPYFTLDTEKLALSGSDPRTGTL